MMRFLLAIAFGFFFASQAVPAAAQARDRNTSGGPLQREQAAYDVLAYDVALTINPEDKSFEGKTIMTARTVVPTISILVDLDDAFSVSKVTDGKTHLRYERLPHALRIFFPMSRQPGDPIRTEILYRGTPHAARRAPWDGGTVWAKTPSGADWISVALQGTGADLIFPCKDHPSDRPDEATMRLTVPEGLVAVGPGVLKSETTDQNAKTATFVWHMPLPIANYSIVFNAAPYETLRDSAKSIDGKTVPIILYLLPESMEHGPKLLAELKKYLAFMEKFCGPYPFRSVKLGVVETPHLGMEHSTSIAYGNKFRFAPDGYDWLLLHEFGHEWWANLVTNADWRDMWIHEGFQSFMDTLYLEQTRGRTAYLEAMKGRRRAIQNRAPVAPRIELSGDDYGGDIYDKGALVLHTLRYLVGDDTFFRSLRRMAYPKPEMEKWADGRAQRLVTTDDFLMIAETESKRELDWFFEAYLRRATLPKLVTEIEGKTLRMRWETPDDLPFPMPVDVFVDGKTVRVPMTAGRGEVTFTSDTLPVVDPDGWVLRAADPR